MNSNVTQLLALVKDIVKSTPKDLLMREVA